MITPRLFASALLVSLVSASLSLSAQSTAVSPPTENLRPLPEPSQFSAAPLSDYAVSLPWTEKRKNLLVPFNNASDKVLKIEGVQSSTGLFVVDFPKTIPAEATRDIEVLFEPMVGASGTVDVIRLRTDQGVKTLRVSYSRPTVATLASTGLSWYVGETPAPKFVVLQLAQGVRPKAAKAMRGHGVEIQDAGGGSYRIVVTPKSTARAETFPVIVQLDPAVPGVLPVIDCTIAPQS